LHVQKINLSEHFEQFMLLMLIAQ